MDAKLCKKLDGVFSSTTKECRGIFTEDELRGHWSDGEQITYKNKSYRVGKMSYGDYFLEPGKEREETRGFNPGTLWLGKIRRYPYFYKVEESDFVS